MKLKLFKKEHEANNFTERTDINVKDIQYTGKKIVVFYEEEKTPEEINKEDIRNRRHEAQVQINRSKNNIKVAEKNIDIYLEEDYSKLKDTLDTIETNEKIIRQWEVQLDVFNTQNNSLTKSGVITLLIELGLM